jgi:phytoene synthase
MRILPRRQRDAMLEIYSFCKRVDDVADTEGPRRERLALLQQWRADVDAMYAGKPPRHLEELAAAVREFGLNREDFHAIIEGMEMDVVTDIVAPDLDTLDLYCDRVASAVGRLSVRVFGMEKHDGIALAHHLGRALQLTNIQRDIDEDASMNRLYLPRELLQEAGILVTKPQDAVASPKLGEVCEHVAAKAREHFAQAWSIMARSPRRAVRAPRIMGAVYRRILDGLVARGWSMPRERVRVGKLSVLAIVLRHAV